MRTPIMRRVASILFAAMLALFCMPTLVARAVGEQVTIDVIGPDGSGNPVHYVTPTTYEVAEGEDAWTLTQRILDGKGLTYDAENSTYGVLLNSINSPYDGQPLAYDEATGRYWQLFVDGVPSEVGISSVELTDGSAISWYYSAYGDELVSTDAGLVIIDPEPPAQSSFPLVQVVAIAAVAGVGAVLYLRSRKNA